MNPAATWATILSPAPMFGPDMIFSCCAQALGVLDMHAEAAEERESRRFYRTKSLLRRLLVGRMREHARPVVRWTAGVAALVVAAALMYLFGLS